MFIVDIALKNTPSMLSVQRKTAEDAEALFHQVMGAIQSGQPSLLQLTCEKDESKRLAVLVNEIAAVQMSDKSGTGSAARTPGFFALTGQSTGQ